ncbi:MAG: metallophosphoesterase, partial [Sphingopyxis sp.]
RLAADHSARGPAQSHIILLGDLVDRGPASCAVVERALGLAATWDRVDWLMGNHEEVMLKALGGDAKLVRYFVRIGGAPTIHSYGLSGAAYDAMSFDELAAAFPPLVPPAHRDFLSQSRDYLVLGDYLFVHAGVKPGAELAAQTPGDMRWIRDEFLHDERHHGKMVVHGHTITDGVDVRPNRIGIDTGAYKSGILTAIGIEGGERWFVST